MLDSGNHLPCGTWGGARNRADRSSVYLSLGQVNGMIEAANFAERIGLAFNRHWTVHYEMAGIAEHDGTSFVGGLLALLGKHVRRAGGKSAGLWARENGDGKGGHVHILLHLPRGMTLRNRSRSWIKAAGGNPKLRVSFVRTIRGCEAGSSSDELSEAVKGQVRDANRRAVLAYLIKGASVETGRALGLPRHGEGGMVVGKRAGWSENIGAAARAKETLR